jgi:undecaprenyl-diphosphatase
MMQKVARPTVPTDPRLRLFGWALALGILSSQVARGHLVFVDQLLAGWMAALRSPALDEPMRVVTFFGGSTWTTLALLGLGALAWRRGGLKAVLILVGAFVVGGLIEIALRLTVPQWRPDTLTLPAAMDPMTRFELAGFPSGHGFRSAFTFGWLIRQRRNADTALATLGRRIALVMIGLVGVSRLYLNRHWASDILGSWLVVLVALSVARVWEQRFCKSS